VRSTNVWSGEFERRTFSPISNAALPDHDEVRQSISPEMAKIFGRFGGIGSIQRSTPRWVEKKKVQGAAAFVRSLA
jgi:hypothetical protein